MKKLIYLFFIFLITNPVFARMGDGGATGGGGAGMIMERHFQPELLEDFHNGDFTGVGGGQDRLINPTVLTGVGVGDGGGGAGNLREIYRNAFNHGDTIADAGGGSGNKNDAQEIFTLWRDNTNENGISGGIIGTLP